MNTDARTVIGPHRYEPSDPEAISPCKVCQYGPANPIHVINLEAIVPRHKLVLALEDDSLYATIECPFTGSDRKCATVYEHDWPDENTCRCEDPDCNCRQGDHDQCAEDFPYVPEMGPGCRLMPADECWYDHMVREVGWSDVLRGAARASVEVELVGGGVEDPIEVVMVDCRDGHDFQRVSDWSMECSRCPATTYDRLKRHAMVSPPRLGGEP